MVYKAFVKQKLEEWNTQLQPTEMDVLFYLLENNTPRGTGATKYLQELGKKYRLSQDRLRDILVLKNRINGAWKTTSGSLSAYGL